MKAKPEEKLSKKLGYFGKSGIDIKQYALIRAAYFDQTEKALELIENDPEQVERQDPHSGLTALHIAVFRSNRELVERLAQHPKSNLRLKDNFGRRAVDMLDYTTDEFIFDTVIQATYPDIAHELEESGLQKEEPQENVISIRPKPDLK